MASNLFFSLDEEISIEDQYEDLLFDDKTFFNQKTVHPVLYKSRITKMGKVQEEYEKLGGLVNAEPISFNHDFTFIDLKSAVDKFHLIKSDFLLKVFQCQSGVQLIELVTRLLKLYKDYIKCWKIEGELDLSGVLMSKEPNPLSIFVAVKSFDSKGGKSVLDIKNIEFDHKEVLFNEAKRLNLLLKNWSE
ncbi:MAG: hypothetical protein ACI9XP_001607 [Lentimonas sp.]|jgi:hypothetical protein